MTPDETWDDAQASVIGGQILFNDYRDVQGADDFELTGAYVITSVTGDYALQGEPPPADGVLVEFFEDLGGFPSEVPFDGALVTAVTLESIDSNGAVIARLTVDLSGANFTLTSGTWWVSITPVDLTPRVGGFYFQLGSSATGFGTNAHFRDGGIDHGNGFPGLYDSDDWIVGSGIPGQRDLDLAMRIEGTPVEPLCSWDLDADDSVGVSDLLSLLAQWATDPGGPPDFDGDNNVGVSDLLALLANWGPCPP